MTLVSNLEIGPKFKVELKPVDGITMVQTVAIFAHVRMAVNVMPLRVNVDVSNTMPGPYVRPI